MAPWFLGACVSLVGIGFICVATLQTCIQNIVNDLWSALLQVFCVPISIVAGVASSFTSKIPVVSSIVDFFLDVACKLATSCGCNYSSGYCSDP
jgi:hypothetical protein